MVVWLAIYVIVLTGSTFEHHDLLCEVKTPLHCTACIASVVGSDPATAAIVGAWTLTDIGCALAFVLSPNEILLPVRSTGRSPPA